MTFIHTMLSALKAMFPDVLVLSVVPLIPFIIAEQVWPVGQAPRIRDYGMPSRRARAVGERSMRRIGAMP